MISEELNQILIAHRLVNDSRVLVMSDRLFQQFKETCDGGSFAYAIHRSKPDHPYWWVFFNEPVNPTDAFNMGILTGVISSYNQ